MDREKLWDNIRQGVKDGVQFTVQKTEELTHIGRLKLDIFSQKRKIDRKFSELGGLVYENQRDSDKEQIEMEPGMRSVILDLRELEQHLHSLEEDLAATDSRPMDEEADEPVEGEVVFIANFEDEKEGKE